MLDIQRITDITTLMRWRIEVIRNVFATEPDRMLVKQNEDYYQRHMADASHIALVAAVNGEDAGCGAICLTEELPSPDNPTGRCAYLMNIYVKREFRNRGIAHAIVRRLIEIASSADCGKIYLESTEQAKNLYFTTGFADLKNMMRYDGV